MRDRSRLPLWLRIAISTFAIALLVVLTQDVQIFPGAASPSSFFAEPTRDPATLPQGVESTFVETADGERLEMWRLPAEASPGAALIFHGNAGDVSNFLSYQQFFQALGVTSYGFDYRGFGKSTGWPSEEGLYADGRAAVRFVLEREKIPVEALTIVGISIGVGPAIKIAHEISAATVLLVTPYISLPAVIKTVPLFGFLHPFSFYTFPVEEIASKLRAPCVTIVHGDRDEVIPHAQGQAVFRAIAPELLPSFISVPNGRHNDAFFLGAGEVARRLSRCARQGSP